jgi:hypothetical protein
VTFLGVSILLIDDVEAAVTTDGFFFRPDPARPGLIRTALGTVAPDDAASMRCWSAR